PQARLVFSGGSGALGGAPFSEAETARTIFAQMGQDPKQLTLESRSRNTHENFLFSKALVKPKRGEVWLLVTSAMHMPRAMAVARKLDWPMLPWPSDYITAPRGRGDLFEMNGNLGLMDYAVHEWIGSLAYRISGKAA
ncbi:MAG TPA: YdcF family protein, partial [Rhizomicrobium sp.]|nr:YdcF family protein [Rhizomicrobium sp.]